MKTFTDPNVAIPPISESDIDRKFVAIKLTGSYSNFIGIAQKVGSEFRWKGSCSDEMYDSGFCFWSATSGNSLMNLIIKSYACWQEGDIWLVSFHVLESWKEFRDFLTNQVC